MKKSFVVFAVVFAVAFVSFSLIGCSQKKEEVPSMEMQTMPAAVQLNNEALAPQAAQKVEPAVTDVKQTVETVGQSVAVSEKPAAEEIQTALKNAGYYAGAIDGKLGPRSKKAIENFQKDNGLVVDGKVGPKTWAKLQPYLTTSPAQKTDD